MTGGEVPDALYVKTPQACAGTLRPTPPWLVKVPAISSDWTFPSAITVLMMPWKGVIGVATVVQHDRVDVGAIDAPDSLDRCSTKKR